MPVFLSPKNTPDFESGDFVHFNLTLRKIMPAFLTAVGPAKPREERALDARAFRGKQ